ncbi:penicillin-binding protein activator [Halofilum ochraceum]|uniref:penicillin-binding protein activator n=1 Tax=Halofilum ochraceum TaxID=1611323 RepID=UPI0008D95293|nr:penicillin-binding protein activator [Halofilum ochraceum]
MRFKALRAVTIPALLLVLIAGCATRPPAGPSAEEQAVEQAQAEARDLLDAGKPLAAVRIYRDLADEAEPEQAQRWRLQIVEALFDAGFPELALEWQRELDARTVPPELETRKAIVDARGAIVQRQGVRALRLLPPVTEDMDDELRARILAVRADAYGITGQPGRALAIRIEREELLSADDAIDANHEAIWSLLQGLPADRLRELGAEEDAPVLNGWAELALAVQRARMGEKPVPTVLDAWREDYAGHPASARFVATLRDRVTEEMTWPRRMALLVPLSGRLANAGQAIRDGLMAAYYDQPDYVERPRIAVYDTGSEGPGVTAAYERAVDAGAEFVIGPLSKDAVAELAGRGPLETPILSLNYLPDNAEKRPQDLYQFGLLPEDEAREAADAAIQNDHFNAVTLVPAGNWGGRMIDGFRSRYETMGGVIVESSRYNSEASDYGRSIQALLNLDSSYARERRLQNTIGRDVRFEPRRRQDIEVIFMAAMPRQARLLEPQLEFHRAGDLPVYATSHVFSGVPDPDSDWDLNGLFFTDLPWILDNLDDPDPLYRSVTEHWPGSRGQYPRLYALGIDAFAVLPHLGRLGENDRAVLNGRTGRLTLDAEQRIHRQPRWATFIKGRPVPVNRPEATPEEEELGEDIRTRAGDS